MVRLLLQRLLLFLGLIQPNFSFVPSLVARHPSTRIVTSAGGPGSLIDAGYEETLLAIRFSVQPGVDEELALSKTKEYTEMFPFAVVLPVQPLQYLPFDGGVEVIFLRKKTAEKGSVDGGIRFYISFADDDDLRDKRRTIEIVAKRNSQGQAISKMFAEKMVVQSFCDGILGKQDDRTGKAPLEYMSVQSMFHRWL